MGPPAAATILCRWTVFIALLHLASPACFNIQGAGNCTCQASKSVICHGLDSFPTVDAGYTDFVFTNCNFGTIGHNNKPNYPDAVTLLLDICKIETIMANAFSGMPKLISLEISGNSLLKSIPKDSLALLPKLEELSLGQNALTELPHDQFATVPTLKLILLEKNELTALPDGLFDNLPQLQRLDFAFNKFTSIPEIIRNISTLKHLDMAGNTIGNFKSGMLKTLTSLQHLDLSTCGAVTADSDAFAGLTNVTMLRLSYNRLTRLPRDLFSPMRTTLQELTLDNNNLVSMEEGTLPIGSLKSLQLGHNQWHCDSKIAWIKDINLPTLDHENVTCSTPQRLAGIPLANVTKELLLENGGGNRSTIAAAIAIPLIIICVLAILYIVYRLIQNRRQSKRAQVRYSAVYRDTVESTKPGQQRPVSEI